MEEILSNKDTNVTQSFLSLFYSPDVYTQIGLKVTTNRDL